MVPVRGKAHAEGQLGRLVRDPRHLDQRPRGGVGHGASQQIELAQPRALERADRIFVDHGVVDATDGAAAWLGEALHAVIAGQLSRRRPARPPGPDRPFVDLAHRRGGIGVEDQRVLLEAMRGRVRGAPERSPGPQVGAEPLAIRAAAVTRAGRARRRLGHIDHPQLGRQRADLAGKGTPAIAGSGAAAAATGAVAAEQDRGAGRQLARQLRVDGQTRQLDRASFRRSRVDCDGRVGHRSRTGCSSAVAGRGVPPRSAHRSGGVAATGRSFAGRKGSQHGQKTCSTRGLQHGSPGWTVAPRRWRAVRPATLAEPGRRKRETRPRPHPNPLPRTQRGREDRKWIGPAPRH